MCLSYPQGDFSSWMPGNLSADQNTAAQAHWIYSWVPHDCGTSVYTWVCLAGSKVPVSEKLNASLKTGPTKMFLYSRCLLVVMVFLTFFLVKAGDSISLLPCLPHNLLPHFSLCSWPMITLCSQREEVRSSNDPEAVQTSCRGNVSTVKDLQRREISALLN